MTAILNSISGFFFPGPTEEDTHSVDSNETVSSRASLVESIRSEPVKSPSLTGRVRELTYAEEAVKAVAKAIVLIAFITLGTFLGSLITLPVPYVGAAIGSGAAFTIAMKILEKMDKYFESRTLIK